MNMTISFIVLYLLDAVIVFLYLKKDKNKIQQYGLASVMAAVVILSSFMSLRSDAVAFFCALGYLCIAVTIIASLFWRTHPSRR
jgi:hypothetical protein